MTSSTPGGRPDDTPARSTSLTIGGEARSRQRERGDGVRNGVSAAGLGLSVPALFGGMAFLSIYLPILSVRERSVAAMMLGVHAPR